MCIVLSIARDSCHGASRDSRLVVSSHLKPTLSGKTRFSYSQF